MGEEDDREGFAPREVERRSDPRYSVDEDSVVVFLGNGAAQQARLVDLSQEGCRLRTRERVTARVRLPVEVLFRVNGVAFRFNGVLQWTDGRNLVGIRFVNVLPRRMLELANVICEMQEVAEARASAVNLLVAEQEVPTMAEREGNQSTDNQNLEAVTEAREEEPAAQTSAEATPAPVGQLAAQTSSRRDRRGQTRHEVDTSATIFLVKIGSTLPGRILDLSLSGCRIRTDERFPVGIYTRVETEFRLEGLPFRLGGVIQAIHNRNMVGIRFLDLSERKRQQVLELIGEIEQMHGARTTDEAAGGHI